MLRDIDICSLFLKIYLALKLVLRHGKYLWQKLVTKDVFFDSLVFVPICWQRA